MLTCFISLRTASGNRHSEMSVTDMILGRWELALTDDVYIINGNGSNIGAQTYNTYQYMGMKRQIVPSSHFSLLPRVCVSSTLAIPTP